MVNSLDSFDSVEDGGQVILTIRTQQSLVVGGYKDREVAGERLPQPDGAGRVRVQVRPTLGDERGCLPRANLRKCQTLQKMENYENPMIIDPWLT